jgi:hypothetical protein
MAGQGGEESKIVLLEGLFGRLAMASGNRKANATT